MIKRWLGAFSPRGDAITEPEDHYECTVCHTVFDEWIESCSKCDNLVIRVVER